MAKIAPENSPIKKKFDELMKHMEENNISLEVRSGDIIIRDDKTGHEGIVCDGDDIENTVEILPHLLETKIVKFE